MVCEGEMFRELNGMVKQHIQYLKHVFKSFELLKLENRPVILSERLKTGHRSCLKR